MQVCIGKHENVHGRQVMDMKKYMGYLPLCMLSIIIVFSLLVYSKRNDFAIGLSTVAAQENKSVGDPDTIKDLKYSFYIMDDYPSIRNINALENIWRVDAVGDTFTTTYDPAGYMEYEKKNAEKQMLYMYAQARYDAKTMNTGAMTKECSTYDDGIPFCTYSGKVDHLTYDIIFDNSRYGYGNIVNFPEVRKRAILRSESGKKDIEVNYSLQEGQDEDDISIYSTYGGGNADDIYGNLKGSALQTIYDIKIKDDFYVSVRALDFDVNLGNLKFDNDPTGIYKVDPQGKVTQIVQKDIKKGTLISMCAINDHLAVVEEEGGKLYGRLYSTEGKLLDEIRLEMDLDQISKVMVSEDQGTLLFQLQSLYDTMKYTVVVYDVKDDAFQKLDRIVMDIHTDTSMYGSYSLYTSMHYDRGKQILYSIQLNDDNGLYVSAQTNKKVLYNSFLYGDYNDDTYLALSDATSSNSYDNIIFSFLNTQRRRLRDLTSPLDGGA